MARVELDTVHPEDAQFREWLRGNRVRALRIEDLPFAFIYEGPREALERMIEEFWNGEEYLLFLIED